MDVITDQENKAGVGKRGEMIFASTIMEKIDDKGIIFEPTFMGEKFPDVDFYVKLNGYNKKKAYFFASVKITNLGFYNIQQTKINILIPSKKIKELKKFQVPVYIFGINNSTEEVFLMNGTLLHDGSSLNGFPIEYPLNKINLLKIWEEVAMYYDCIKEITNFRSIFT